VNSNQKAGGRRQEYWNNGIRKPGIKEYLNVGIRKPGK